MANWKDSDAKRETPFRISALMEPIEQLSRKVKRQNCGIFPKLSVLPSRHM